MSRLVIGLLVATLVGACSSSTSSGVPDSGPSDLPDVVTTEVADEESTAPTRRYESPVPPFYTVILASLSSGSNTDADALASAERLAAQYGVEARVLLSDDFGSLSPGYWVVYAGEFSESTEAISEADRLKGLGHPDAYAKQVTAS